MPFGGHASLWGACLGATLWLVTASSWAQGGATDSAGAQVLWEEAVTLAKAGSFEEACPKFAASQELDPQLGTLLALADCYTKIGKTASAWASFVEAAELAKQRDDKREESARTRAAELEFKLSKLRVTVAQKVDGLKVRRGDTPVSEPQWGLELPVDPGELTITASADGYEPWETTVQIEKGGEVTEVEIPELTKLSLGNGGGAGYGGGRGNGEPYNPLPQMVAGAVVGAVGLIGIGVGAGFAVIAGNKDKASLTHCPTDPTVCDPEGVALRDDARQAQTVEIVSFVAGGVLSITGGLLILTAWLSQSSDEDDASSADVGLVPTLSTEGGGLTVSGRF